MINKNKLCACMKLYGDTVQSLADALGIAISTMSCKINGKVKFSLEDVCTIALRYDLSPVEVAEIFLTRYVTNRHK